MLDCKCVNYKDEVWINWIENQNMKGLLWLMYLNKNEVDYVCLKVETFI